MDYSCAVWYNADNDHGQGDNAMAFLKNLLHPLQAQDTTHLTDGEIQLLIRQYHWGSPYVGGLPSYFFKIVDA